MTNGALGLLPLSLLPTAPAQVAANEDVLFASYRNVPWLARTHAVTMVPSSAALRTLAQPAAGQARAQRTDRVRRSVFLARSSTTRRRSRCRLRMRPARRMAATTTRGVPLEAPQLAETRRRRQRRAGAAAAAAGHGGRTEIDRAGAAGRPGQGAQPRQGRQREERQDDGPVRLQGPGVRDPRPRAGRTQRPDAAGAGAVGAGCRRAPRATGF